MQTRPSRLYLPKFDSCLWRIRAHATVRFFTKFARSCRSSGLTTTRNLRTNLYGGETSAYLLWSKMPQTHSLHGPATLVAPLRERTYAVVGKNHPSEREKARRARVKKTGNNPSNSPVGPAYSFTLKLFSKFSKTRSECNHSSRRRFSHVVRYSTPKEFSKSSSALGVR
jgi:hypothetical protein